MNKRQRLSPLSYPYSLKRKNSSKFTTLEKIQQFGCSVNGFICYSSTYLKEKPQLPLVRPLKMLPKESDRVES
jgi:hypothetical protein